MGCYLGWTVGSVELAPSGVAKGSGGSTIGREIPQRASLDWVGVTGTL